MGAVQRIKPGQSFDMKMLWPGLSCSVPVRLIDIKVTHADGTPLSDAELDEYMKDALPVGARVDHEAKS